MKKLSLFIALFFVLNSFSVMAVSKDRLPIYDDFDDLENVSVTQNKTGYKTTITNAKSHYAKIRDGKIAVNVGNGESGAIRLTKNFETPYAGNELNFEFDFSIEGDEFFYSYLGMPILLDSKGGEHPLMKITNAKQGYTVPGDRAINVNANSLVDMAWQTGVEYKIKIDINIKEKSYQIYIDKGEGYEKKQTVSGDSTFSLNAENVSGFSFCFLGNSTNQACYLLDNIKLTTPYEYIYLSDEGDDSNDGSRDNPVKTPERAYSLASEKKTLNRKHVFIRVLSGSYEFNKEYTLGAFDENTEYREIAFAPENGGEISVSGDFEIDIPELKGFADEKLKESFINDLKENYISGYNAAPLEVGNVSFERNEQSEIESSLWLSNSGRVEAKAVVVAAMYDKNGSLVDVSVNGRTIMAGERAKLSAAVNHDNSYDNYTVKTYLWQDLENMIPIFDMQLSTELDVNIKNSSLYDIRTVVSGEKIELNGKGEPQSFVALKMTSESGNIVYMNQIPVDEEGSFSYLINPQYMPAGLVTLSISTNGGAVNE